MKRDKLLSRQEGERQLGFSRLSEDYVSPCVRLANSPMKRHRDHGGVQLLHSNGVDHILVEEHHHLHHCGNDHNKTRECVTRSLQIIEHDWLPLPDDDDDCTSYCTVATGMPSLASINPGSVTDTSCSVHSSCGLNKFGSMVSISSSVNNACDPEDASVTSHSISVVSEEPTLRQRMKVLLLEDINEEARAETLDCLEPVLVSSRDSSRNEMTRWGSPPCETEITVCRPQEHYECSTASVGRDRRRGTTVQHHKHALASRNADDAPPLPPPVNRMFLSTDQSPMVPRRHCASEVYVRPTPPVDIDRRKSWDHMPYKPQRQNSNSRCTA